MLDSMGPTLQRFAMKILQNTKAAAERTVPFAQEPPGYEGRLECLMNICEGS